MFPCLSPIQVIALIVSMAGVIALLSLLQTADGVEKCQEAYPNNPEICTDAKRYQRVMSIVLLSPTFSSFIYIYMCVCMYSILTTSVIMSIPTIILQCCACINGKALYDSPTMYVVASGEYQQYLAPNTGVYVQNGIPVAQPIV
jgi:hypothetical protein